MRPLDNRHVTIDGDRSLFMKHRTGSQAARTDGAPQVPLAELERTLKLLIADKLESGTEEIIASLGRALSLTRAAAAAMAAQERQARRVAAATATNTRREIEALRADISRANSAAVASAAAVERLSRELADAEGTVRTLDVELSRVEVTLAERKKDNGRLQEELVAARAVNAESARASEQLLLRVEEADQAGAAARAAVEGQRQELERAHGRIISLTSALEAAPADAEADPAELPSPRDGEEPPQPSPDGSGTPQGSVCYRLPDHSTPRELKEQGWAISNGVWLCAECAGRGWRLPPQRRWNRFRFGGA